MITEIEVENVRLFEGSGWKFSLAPLTLFCGFNSSGKSTLLYSLLLMKQSQEQRIKIARPKFNGSEIDLWNYEAFVSDRDINKDMNISLTMTSTMSLELLKRYFNITLSNNIKGKAKIEYILKSKFVFKSNPIYPEKSEELDKYGYLHQCEYELRVQSEDNPIFTWKVEYDSTLLNHEQLQPYQLIIPKKYAILLKLPKELSKQIETKNKDSDFIKVQLGLDGLFPFICAIPTTITDDDIHVNTIFPIEMIRQIDVPITELKKNIERIAYLEASRQKPQRFYNRSGDFRKIDSEGRFVPHLLHELGQNPIEYIRPHENKIKTDTLIDALNIWLYYIRTGIVYPDTDSIPKEIVIESSKFMVEIHLHTPYRDNFKNYPSVDSGIGFTKILPILATVLYRKNTIILIEEPEVDTNPSMQVRLAEFFVTMCNPKLNKQIILETHSEHIVNTVRVLAAEDETGEIANNSKVYFLEVVENKPMVHNLSIQPNGVVPNWPPSFFGEAMNLTGRLLRAQKRFRRQ